MMVDGKWDADGSSTSNWSEPAGGGVADYIQNNGGRGAGGHGICPVNWHVPTDAELADILNAMELSGGTVHNSGNGVYRGSNSDSGAGARGKSVCRGTATDTDAYWANFASRYGNDAYGFRVLPAGYRNSDGSDFRYRGNMAYFWSSSAYGITRTWIRAFGYSEGSVVRSPLNRSNGFSVRCIRDE
jgi:uncharacterized protein (TIGR02145 family)